MPSDTSDTPSSGKGRHPGKHTVELRHAHGANDRVTGSNRADHIDTSNGCDAPDRGYPGAYPSDPFPENDRDLVNARGGDDFVWTGDDRDTVLAGNGRDTVYAGVDDDHVDGGQGRDYLVGGEGNDVITGGQGRDTIIGGNDGRGGFGFPNLADIGPHADLRPDNDRDTLSGGHGNDLIFGGDDDDWLSGDAGRDLIDGGYDDDVIFGGSGRDTLLGGQGNDTLDGGAGADLMLGGADRDVFTGLTAGDRVDGGHSGDDFDTLDLTGFAEAHGSFDISYTSSDREDGVVHFFDNTGNAAGQLAFTEIENIVPCFTPGTLIATPKGEVPVETLSVGDRVLTRDNGPQEIRWVGAKGLTGAEIGRAQHLRPVRVKKGALGGDLPERDMMVSPNHRVLVANSQTALYFEDSEVLVAAKHLTGLEGVDIIDVPWITYVHLLFDQHEVILSDGAWTESFQPGEITLRSIGNAQRTEILELFPDLAGYAGADSFTAARRSLKRYEARLLTR